MGKTKLVTVRITHDEDAIFLRLGKGDRSAGIRRAAQIARVACDRLAGEPTSTPADAARVTPADLLPDFLPAWPSVRARTPTQQFAWVTGRLEKRGWRPQTAAAMAPRLLALLRHHEAHKTPGDTKA